jgi:hypothetical protein
MIETFPPVGHCFFQICADRLTLKDSGKRRPHPPSRKKPQDSNDHSQRQTRGRHENVKAKYVDNDRPQDCKRQRHVAICKQQDRRCYLQQKNHRVKPGHEHGSQKLRGKARGRWHVNKVKESVEPERQKDQTE